MLKPVLERLSVDELRGIVAFIAVQGAHETQISVADAFAGLLTGAKHYARLSQEEAESAP